MFAVNHGDVVVEGDGVVIEVRDGVGAAADGELTFGHLQTVGLGLVEIDAQRIGVDVAGSVAAIVSAAQIGDVRRVHHGGVDGPVFAHGVGLHALRVAGLRGDEDVGGRE